MYLRNQNADISLSESSKSTSTNIEEENNLPLQNDLRDNNNSIQCNDSNEVLVNHEMPNGGQMLMIPTLDNTNDVVSTTTESEAIITLANQSDLYSNPNKEEVKPDTEKTLQRYIKKIFRQVKFLTDVGRDYNEPNFVNSMTEKSQSAEICEYLWKSLGMLSFID